MTLNNCLKNNYKQWLKLRLVHICNCLRRLQDQLKVLTSYSFFNYLHYIFNYLYIYIYLMRDAINQRNIQKRATVRKWYVRKYFELEIYPEMHFQGESIIRRSKTNKTTFNITYHPVFRDVRFQKNYMRFLHLMMGIRNYILTFL